MFHRKTDGDGDGDLRHPQDPLFVSNKQKLKSSTGIGVVQSMSYIFLPITQTRSPILNLLMTYHNEQLSCIRTKKFYTKLPLL